MALAAKHLMQTETYLDFERMITLVDLVLQNLKLATVYLRLEREDYLQSGSKSRDSLMVYQLVCRTVLLCLLCMMYPYM